MIFDVLDNAHRYQNLNQRFAKAIEFLRRSDLKNLPEGKYEIDGEHIYAIVSKGPGRKKENAQLEIHMRYIDIQFVLAGTDEMGWKSRSRCKEAAGEYDQKNDVQCFKDEPDTWFSTGFGAFAIFFPEDAHMPLISPGMLHKVVVKVETALGSD